MYMRSTKLEECCVPKQKGLFIELMNILCTYLCMYMCKLYFLSEAVVLKSFQNRFYNIY